MRSHPITVLATVCLLASLLATASAEPPKENLLTNPSIEQQTDDKPIGWATKTWSGEGSFEVADVGRTGRSSLMVGSEQGADISWFAEAAVEPHTIYRLSGWIRTEKVQVKTGRGVQLALMPMNYVRTQPVTGTSDWTRVEAVFNSAANDTLSVHCLFGGWGQATGRAWFDDLRLEKIAAAKDWQPSIAVDATKTGPPISKYVYGQFIEHLGRCINEGLWAEMLLDRKFFYPVGSEESPWKPISEGLSVTMETDAPFVGEQTPRIQLGGIVQGGLGVLKGKSYAGRIWLAGDEEVLSVQISLVWGDGPNDRQTIAATKLTPEFRKIPLQFTAGRTTGQARLEITSRDRGGIRVGTVSLMPADNVEGIRADVLELLRQIDGTVYRWPGGNFVSGYNWRDGIGDIDRRPPRKNPAWENIEPNDFGIDEFLTLCRLLRTEPYIVVNSGQGEAQEAVDELQYINGPADSPMGKLRAKNGHREPYGVNN